MRPADWTPETSPPATQEPAPVGYFPGKPVPSDPDAIADADQADGFLHLRVIADTLDDIMRTRIAVTSRVDFAAIDGFAVGQHLAGMVDTESKLKLALRRQFRVAAPAVRAWTMATVGLGEPIMARFLGAVGDPVHAQPYEWSTSPDRSHLCGPNCGKERHLIPLEPFERTPRQFLSYCGWGDPARRRRVGMTAAAAAALGNQRAKPLAYVMAESCIKQIGGTPTNRATVEQVTDPSLNGAPRRTALAELLPASQGDLSEENPAADEFTAGHLISIGGDPGMSTTTEERSGRRRSPYRDVYDLGRERYTGREGWTPGHQHQAAIRLTVKAILIDVWRVHAGHAPRWPQPQPDVDRP